MDSPMGREIDANSWGSRAFAHFSSFFAKFTGPTSVSSNVDVRETRRNSSIANYTGSL